MDDYDGLVCALSMGKKKRKKKNRNKVKDEQKSEFSCITMSILFGFLHL